MAVSILPISSARPKAISASGRLTYVKRIARSNSVSASLRDLPSGSTIPYSLFPIP